MVAMHFQNIPISCDPIAQRHYFCFLRSIVVDNQEFNDFRILLPTTVFAKQIKSSSIYRIIQYLTNQEFRRVQIQDLSTCRNLSGNTPDLAGTTGTSGMVTALHMIRHNYWRAVPPEVHITRHIILDGLSHRKCTWSDIWFVTGFPTDMTRHN